MRLAEVPLEAVQEYAVKERVCIRPLLRRVIDRETGEAVLVALSDEVDADLIVVGRFSQHRRRVGSTAQRVLDLASSPTLTVNQLGKPVSDHAQCPDCARVRASSDGEVWFCDRHRDRDRDTLATTLVLPSTIWTGGTLMW